MPDISEKIRTAISETQGTRWIAWHKKYKNVLSITEYHDLGGYHPILAFLHDFQDHEYNKIKLSAINEALKPLGKLALPVLFHDDLDWRDFNHLDHFEPHDGGIVYYLVIVDIMKGQT